MPAHTPHLPSIRSYARPIGAFIPQPHQPEAYMILQILPSKLRRRQIRGDFTFLPVVHRAA